MWSHAPTERFRRPRPRRPQGGHLVVAAAVLFSGVACGWTPSSDVPRTEGVVPESALESEASAIAERLALTSREIRGLVPPRRDRLRWPEGGPGLELELDPDSAAHATVWLHNRSGAPQRIARQTSGNGSPSLRIAVETEFGWEKIQFEVHPRMCGVTDVFEMVPDERHPYAIRIPSGDADGRLRIEGRVGGQQVSTEAFDGHFTLADVAKTRLRFTSLNRKFTPLEQWQSVVFNPVFHELLRDDMAIRSAALTAMHKFRVEGPPDPVTSLGALRRQVVEDPGHPLYNDLLQELHPPSPAETRLLRSQLLAPSVLNRWQARHVARLLLVHDREWAVDSLRSLVERGEVADEDVRTLMTLYDSGPFGRTRAVRRPRISGATRPVTVELTNGGDQPLELVFGDPRELFDVECELPLSSVASKPGSGARYGRTRQTIAAGDWEPFVLDPFSWLAAEDAPSLVRGERVRMILRSRVPNLKPSLIELGVGLPGGGSLAR